MTTKSNAWTQGVRFSKFQLLLEARIVDLTRKTRKAGRAGGDSNPCLGSSGYGPLSLP